jgi:DNA-binding CsgD family transcriptional regulator
VREIIQDLDDSVTPDDNWKAFEKQLNNTYPDFMRKLSEECPMLAPMELKICCLIKINLSNKDIAMLLFISPRTVETHRYNIGKKLDLKGVRLSAFLAGL